MKPPSSTLDDVTRDVMYEGALGTFQFDDAMSWPNKNIEIRVRELKLL